MERRLFVSDKEHIAAWHGLRYSRHHVVEAFVFVWWDFCWTAMEARSDFLGIYSLFVPLMSPLPYHLIKKAGWCGTS